MADGAAAAATRTQANPALVKALARAFRLQRMLDGRYASLSDWRVRSGSSAGIWANATGKAGVLDMVAALRWVTDNAAAFPAATQATPCRDQREQVRVETATSFSWFGRLQLSRTKP